MVFIVALHKPWDDHDTSERAKHGAIALEKGREWVRAARRHVGNRIYYYYLHWIFAHIKESIVENGHPLAGDDSVLEKGNNDAGNLKHTIYWGGSDVASKRRIQVTRQRVTIGADGQEVKVASQVTRENAHGQAYQMMGMQLMHEHISAEKRARALQIKTEAQLETKRVKREAELAQRDSVIDELSAATSSAE